MAPRALTARSSGEPWGEKDFYLEEFRGRSVLFAVDPTAAVRAEVATLASAVGDLVRNGTRVLVHWPQAIGERRLVAALERALPRRGGARGARLRASTVRLGSASLEVLRAACWTALGQTGVCLCLVPTEGAPAYPTPAVALATTLRVSKLVLLDRAGGLLGPAPGRLSFADENVLETLLQGGVAEWSGLGARLGVLAAVRDALQAGVEAVNLCTLEGVGDELFTYAGSGTLFTPRDYCHVAPLALDDFAQAERLLERGQREGFLKARSAAEMAEVLGAGFGATISGRHLAGVAALLTAPYAAEQAGEIAGLYTITRFKGEGIGERLVDRLVGEAGRRGLRYVFACVADERAQEFFRRRGFERVAPDAVPGAKWDGYDSRRRERVAVFRQRLSGEANG